MAKFEKADLVGQRFGKLTVVEFAGNNKHSQTTWRARCDCGEEKVASIASLRGGKTRSCGCLRKESWAERPAKVIRTDSFDCSRCHESKPLSEKDPGRSTRCVPCGKDYRHEWYVKNQAKCKASSAMWRRANPEQAREGATRRRRSNPARYLFQLARARARRKGLEFTITEQDVVVPDTCPVLGIPLSYGVPGRRTFPLPGSPTLDRFDSTRGYVPGNVTVISWRANSLKKDGTAEEFEKITTWMKERHHDSDQ